MALPAPVRIEFAMTREDTEGVAILSQQVRRREPAARLSLSYAYAPLALAICVMLGALAAGLTRSQFVLEIEADHLVYSSDEMRWSTSLRRLTHCSLEGRFLCIWLAQAGAAPVVVPLRAFSSRADAEDLCRTLNARIEKARAARP